MMKTNILNWYRLSNWLDLTFQYRLVEVTVEGIESNTRELNKAFFNAVNFLASETKGVVSVTNYHGKRYIAVKHDAQLERKVIPGSPLDTILTPLDGVFTLNTSSIDDDQLDLALKFLESSIEFQLHQNKNLWDGGTNTFLNKIPLRESKDIETDIYHGFKYKIVAEDKRNVFVCIGLAYKYVDKFNLHEALKSVPAERVGDDKWS